MTISSKSNIRLVYCFSKKLAITEEQYTLSLSLLFKSIELSSKIYSVKVYTDQVTYSDLTVLDVPVIILHQLDLVFIDDFKFTILDFLKPDEIFIDADVLIYSKLDLNLTKDIIFDFVDYPTSKWYRDSFLKLSGTQLKYQLDQIGKPVIVPNLGFLKINSPDLLESYKKIYKFVRQLLLEQAKEIHPISQFSMILGQYVLGIVLDLKKYSYFSISKNNGNEIYKHLSGPNKFRKQQLI